mgnify:CR=1 FL=1
MNKKMMKGFTLVEIMIVVAIIAVLAAIAIPNFIAYRTESQKRACESNISTITMAIHQRLRPDVRIRPSTARKMIAAPR